MTSPQILFIGFYITIGAAMIVMLASPRNAAAPIIASFGSLASVILASAGVLVLIGHEMLSLRLWSLPGLGPLSISVDRLSGFFLIVTAMVFLPVSLFSAGYAKRYANRYSLKAMGINYLALLASISLVESADSVVLFLLAWEAVAIFSYLLVNFEHEREKTRSAAYLFLAMAEAGTAAVVIAFVLLAVSTHTFAFPAIRAAASSAGPGLRWAVFLLSFLGFAVKAGLVPVNSWLPRAHPAAPANVSAILSGAVLNVGLYGIIRVNGDLLPQVSVGPGVIALGVGAVSALVGILYATTANDLKTMLAHSSTENIGIVSTGVGASFVFSAAGHPSLAAFLIVAALYHMMNHSVYKSLLFMGTGSIDEAVGTRDLDKLGGLAKWMPLTSLFFLVGALSISAIPPLNGFASEWLTLQGLLRGAEFASRGLTLAFVLAGVLLALTAGLAVTCFIKAFGMAFLGLARSREVRSARERKGITLFALGIPALLCLVLGVLPTYTIPVIDSAVRPAVVRGSATQALVPPFYATSPTHGELSPSFVKDFSNIGAQVGQVILPGRGLVVMHRGGSDHHVVFAMSPSYGLLILLVLGGGTFLGVRIASRRRKRRKEGPWDGGLHRLLPEMTYTATGFSNPVRVVFRAVFRPHADEVRETVATHFRTSIRRRYEEEHVVNRLFILPITRAARGFSNLLARLHNGRINSYVIYVLVTLAIFVLIAWLTR